MPYIACQNQPDGGVDSQMGEAMNCIENLPAPGGGNQRSQSPGAHIAEDGQVVRTLNWKALPPEPGDRGPVGLSLRVLLLCPGNGGKVQAELYCAYMRARESAHSKVVLPCNVSDVSHEFRYVGKVALLARRPGL